MATAWLRLRNIVDRYIIGRNQWCGLTEKTMDRYPVLFSGHWHFQIRIRQLTKVGTVRRKGRAELIRRVGACAKVPERLHVIGQSVYEDDNAMPFLDEVDELDTIMFSAKTLGEEGDDAYIAENPKEFREAVWEKRRRIIMEMND